MGVQFVDVGGGGGGFFNFTPRALRRLFEAVGLFLVACSLFLLLCLLTYDEADLIILVMEKGGFVNFGGKLGFVVSDWFLGYFGFSAYLVPFGLMSLGIPMFYGTRLPGLKSKVFSLMFSMVSCSFILGSFGGYENAFDFLIGGYVGHVLIGVSRSTHFFVPIYTLIVMVFVVSTYSALEFSGVGIVGRLRDWFSHVSCLIFGRGVSESYSDLGDSRVVGGSISESTRKVFEDFTDTAKKSPGHKLKIRNLQSSPRGSSKKLSYREYVAMLDFPAGSGGTREDFSANEEVALNVEKALFEILLSFGINAEVVGFKVGPVITMFEIEPSPGTRSARIVGLADDIARSLKVQSARISVIPGKSSLAIEVPNRYRETVYLGQILRCREFAENDFSIPICLGKNIMGTSIVVDLATMPHLLIAGTTGSGKSVGINSMILSILYKLSPEECGFVMIDPKMLELSVYDGIPHLLSPVVTSPEKAVVALQWAVKEMERRYRDMSKIGVRGIAGYNEYVEAKLNGFNEGDFVDSNGIRLKKMPFIVVVIDEMADLMITAGKVIESCVQRLSQMARAAGIHVIMATQRPSVDVITGVIKANFPVRISYRVTSKVDSRTILNFPGAEQLLGKGDMIYMPYGSKTYRIHAPFVSDSEVAEVIGRLKGYEGDSDSVAFGDELSGPGEFVGGGVVAPGRVDLKLAGNDFIDVESEPSFFDGGNSGSHEAPSGGFGDELESLSALVSEPSLSDDESLYLRAASIVVKDNRPSISYIQRKLKVGYNKAANLMEKLEQEGVVSAADVNGKRMVLAGRREK